WNLMRSASELRASLSARSIDAGPTSNSRAETPAPAAAASISAPTRRRPNTTSALQCQDQDLDQLPSANDDEEHERDDQQFRDAPRDRPETARAGEHGVTSLRAYSLRAPDDQRSGAKIRRKNGRASIRRPAPRSSSVPARVCLRALSRTQLSVL